MLCGSTLHYKEGLRPLFHFYVLHGTHNCTLWCVRIYPLCVNNLTPIFGLFFADTLKSKV
ncbi:hypothetical protein SLP22_0001 [Salmonella phage BAU.Micro_SLP-22]